MSGRKDGGPAFGHGNHEQGGCEGMSLRDWFAGQALAGMCGYSGMAGGSDAGETMQDRAKNAYAHADAMLAERSKP